MRGYSSGINKALKYEQRVVQGALINALSAYLFYKALNHFLRRSDYHRPVDEKTDNLIMEGWSIVIINRWVFLYVFYCVVLFCYTLAIIFMDAYISINILNLNRLLENVDFQLSCL